VTRVTRAYLSLGSNIEPEKYLRAAIAELRARFGAVQLSPVYSFPPVGFDGDDFLNLAAAIDTDLDVFALNDWLHALEDRNGRRRDVPRFFSRTLDVDIVLFGDLVIEAEGNLHVPRGELRHPFVLKPMNDIAPEVMHPTVHKTIGQLWKEFPKHLDRGQRVADL
jgi:2-amino-4-hydroxy-6-hydroxymethyldihydropteridine diphosphokinase